MADMDPRWYEPLRQAGLEKLKAAMWNARGVDYTPGSQHMDDSQTWADRARGANEQGKPDILALQQYQRRMEQELAGPHTPWTGPDPVKSISAQPMFPKLTPSDLPPPYQPQRPPLLNTDEPLRPVPPQPPLPRGIHSGGPEQMAVALNSEHPNPFLDIGKYTPQSPSSRPPPNDALKFWQHPSPKVIPIREGSTDHSHQSMMDVPLSHLQHMAGDVLYPTPFSPKNYSDSDYTKMLQTPSGAAAIRAMGGLSARPSNVLPLDPGVAQMMMPRR